MSTVTIELREEDATVNNANGDYQVNLKQPIPIYPDDVVSIRNVFIDSVEAGETSVVIDEDTTVELDFCNYIQNWGATNVPNPSYLTNDTQKDLDVYFACQKASVPDMNNLFAVGQINLFRESPTVNGGKWGRAPDQPPLFLNFRYRDPANNGQFLVLNIGVPQQSGAKDELNITHTDNHAVPMFITGDIVDLEIAANNPITLLNPQDVRPEDNIDTKTLFGGNTASTGRKTWTNTYKGSDFRRLTQFNFQRQGGAGTTMGNGAKLTFECKNWRTGLQEQFDFTIAASINSDNGSVTITPNIDCIAGGLPISRPFTDSTGTMRFVAPLSFPQDCPLNELPFNIATEDENENGDFFMQGIVLANALIDLVVHIKTSTESIVIPKGKYTINELCEKLTDGFTSLTLNGDTFTTYAGNNNFLKTVNRIRAENALGANDLQYFTRADGGSLFTYDNNVQGTIDPFVGTPQVAIVADTVLNKVKFSAIHQNLLATAAPNVPITKFVAKGNGTTHELIGRNGGVVFTGMRPQSFWESLGFEYTEDKKIFVNFGNTRQIIAGTGYILNTVPTDLGRFTTTSQSGLDNAIVKTNPYIFTGLPALSAGAGGQAQTNVEIIATNSIAQSGDSDGYFMVEVRGITTTETVGQHLNSNTIGAIISRYNTIGSYTSAYNEGSIPVSYQGEPTMFSSFGVRILNAKGELSNDVENKSSIFLQIERAPQN